MTSWSQVAVYVFLVVVFLGVCLYGAFNYLVSVVPPYVVAGFEVTYLQSTMLSDMLPWFFWTALCFVVAGVGVGLYTGSHVIVKGRWEIVVYIFAPAFLIAFLQNFAFFWVIGRIPAMPGLGTFTQETTLSNFFVGTCGLPLFCFVLAGIGIGLYIGSHVDRSIDLHEA